MKKVLLSLAVLSSLGMTQEAWTAQRSYKIAAAKAAIDAAREKRQEKSAEWFLLAKKLRSGALSEDSKAELRSQQRELSKAMDAFERQELDAMLAAVAAIRGE